MATNTKRLRVLRELYAALPPVACKGLCVASCSHIMVTPVEVLNIETATGSAPPLTSIGDHSMLTPVDQHGRCPYLVLGRCSIYEARPFICRAFGAAPGIACVHGCTSDPVLSDETAGAMIRMVAKL